MHLSYFVLEKPNEKIIYMLRRHWITFIPIVLILLVMLAVPVVVYFFIQKLFPDLLTGPTVFPLVVLLGSTYALFAYLFFYIQFLDYYLELWIVTNDRIIDINQRGLFNREIVELELFRIQDITSEVKGAVATVLHYGDLHITTASSTDFITFRQIPKPEMIREALIQLADEDLKEEYKEDVAAAGTV